MGVTSFAKLMPLLLLAVPAPIIALPQAATTTGCTASHPLVGQSFQFSCAAGFTVSGVAKIVDDCTLQVTGFSVVGDNSPSFNVFELDILDASARVALLQGAFNPSALVSNAAATQTLTLLTGKTWDIVNALAIVPSQRGLPIAGVVFTKSTATTTWDASATWGWTAVPTPTADGASIVTSTAAPIVVTPPPPTATVTGVSTTVPTMIASPTVVVTVAPYTSYPNPPTQLNVSFHLQNFGETTLFETPILQLTRGVNYTFLVEGGDKHPFYFTTSEDGAKGMNENSTETKFAGGAVSHGTVAAPFVLNFVPDNSMPDQFFYQCWFHKRMGFKTLLTGSFAAPSTTASGAATPAANLSSDSPRSASGTGVIAALVVVAAVFLL